MTRRHYRPVKVRNPRTDGYSVIVHSCQEFHIILNNPVDIFLDATKEDYWLVTSNSDYFVLKSAKDVPGKKIWRFIQYHDLKKWTDISNVFLGNIRIELISKEVKESPYNLCVVAVNADEKINKVITVVNPKTCIVKVKSNEILETVFCSDNESSDVWAHLYDVTKNDILGCEVFEKLRQESFIFPSPIREESQDIYFTGLKNVSKLPVSSLSYNISRSEITVNKQHHFWFRLRPEQISFVAKSNKGRPIANIVIGGANKHNFCSNVKLIVNTKTNYSPNFAEYDKIHHEGQHRGLSSRYYSPLNGLLVNPAKSEFVEFLTSSKEILVEIAPPECFWHWLEGRNSKWSYKVQNFSKDKPYVEVITLRDRKINNKTIQRFLIRSLYEKLHDGCAMAVLNSVLLSCNESGGEKTINCWFVDKRSRTYDESSSVVPGNYHKRHLPKERHATKELTVIPNQPKYVHKVLVLKVKITEEITDSLHCQAATVSKLFSSIEITAPITKKKDTVIIPTASNLPAPSPKSTRNIDEDIVANRAVLLTTTGKEVNCITLNPGQYAVIRYYLYNWQYKCDMEYFWCINPVHISHQKFFINGNSLKHVNKQMYQQITISLCHNKLPKSEGSYILGGIKAQNLDYLNYTVLKLNIEKDKAIVTSQDSINSLRELLDAIKVVRDKEKAKPKEEGVWKLIRDPDDKHVIKIKVDDTIKITLTKRQVSYGNRTSAFSWWMRSYPKWINVINTVDFPNETAYTLKVNKSSMSCISEEILFRSNELSKKIILVPDFSLFELMGKQ